MPVGTLAQGVRIDGRGQNRGVLVTRQTRAWSGLRVPAHPIEYGAGWAASVDDGQVVLDPTIDAELCERRNEFPADVIRVQFHNSQSSFERLSPSNITF